jgi:putative MATE family efflux protein
MTTTAPATTPDARAPLTPRARVMLEGPIVPTLLGLAAPTVTVMVLQAGVTVADAYFVGWLGPEALAGVSLVFPLLMLMQTMSAGGMGGGVASAVARALGAGRREDANALAAHALVIGLAMGASFSLVFLASGPALYRLMGGAGSTLDAALAYSNAIFAGALAYWLFHTLASVVRGTGNMVFPAALAIAGGVIQVGLTPPLVMGWGLPRLGVAGAAVAAVTSFTLGSLVLLVHLLSGRAAVRLTLRGLHLEATHFAEILRVGALGSVNTVLTNLTMAVLAGLVGHFGPFALAGYGMGARLEYLQIPIVFGLGSALVTMVGTNVGAGRRERAERIAWSGAGFAAALTATVGLAGALFPHRWIGIFSAEPEVLAAGATYLGIVGPAYGFFGFGLALYFASQGAGRLLWPVAAGVIRLVIAGAGGWLAIRELGADLPALYALIAAALVVYGAVVAAAIKAGAWRAPARRF